MKKAALIVAGGRGERMQSNIPKQFILLNNLPVLMHTLKKFAHFDHVVVVLPQNQFDYWKKICKDKKFTQKHCLVAGGKNRFSSVKNGLEKIDSNIKVCIHDGVRPLVSKSLVDNTMNLVRKGFGVVPVLPVKQSLRIIKDGTSKHINRNNLYHVQTPQCFLSSEIKQAYSTNYFSFFSDDASVFESFGGNILTLKGEENNIKITTQSDLEIAPLFTQ